MKQLFSYLSLAICCLTLTAQPGGSQSLHDRQARQSPDWFRRGLTYQVMPRSMSEAGTLKGAEAHLERLRDLGVTTLYLMPVNVADTDMDQAHWSPRQIRSGYNDPRNPYRAADYFHVDPEYGTDQDLKDYIDHAHELGMKVLLDLVSPMVEDKDSLTVKEMPSDSDREVVLHVRAKNDDIARLIGRKGSMASALRQVMSVASHTDDKRVTIKFEEIDGEERA